MKFSALSVPPTKKATTNPVAKTSIRFLLAFVLLSVGGKSWGQVLWSSAGGSAWLTGSNWTGGAVPNGTQIAQFGTNPTAATGVGINFNSTTNAGVQALGQRIQEVGAVEVTSARTAAFIIGNSSGTAGATGTFRPLGVTVNSVANTILRNNSNQLFTLQNIQGSGNQTMGVELGNATDNVVNIDGTGGITIISIISGTNRKLTKGGSGTGVLLLLGANTYTGVTTVSAGTLRLNRTGGTTIPATNDVVINGGTLQISTNQTLNNLTLVSGATLLIDNGITLTINGTFNQNGGTINLTGTGNIVYGATGTLTYGGGSTQTTTSAEFPTTNGPFNLNINNSVSVFFPAAFTRMISGTVTMQQGTVTQGGGDPITYGPSGILVYAGSTEQNAGHEWPISNGPSVVIINNTSGVKLDIHLFRSTGELQLASGNLNLNGKYLTIRNLITGSDNRSITNSSGSGHLTFSNTGVTISNSLTSLNIAPSTGFIFIDADGPFINNTSLTADAFINTHGAITNNGALTIKGQIFFFEGSSATGNNFIYDWEYSGLIYLGTTARTTTDVEFPATNGPAVLRYEVPAGLTLHAPRTIKYLNANVGPLTNAGSLTIIDEGYVQIGDASLDATPIYSGTINFVYINSTDISTGLEIPGITTTILDFSAAGSGNLTLSQDIVVNGIASVGGSGKLILGSKNITANTADRYNTGYIVTNGTGVLTLKNISTTPVLFPIGSSASSYNPVTISNGGGDDFSGRVKSTFTNAPLDVTKVVNVEWIISKTGTQIGNSVTITPQWKTTDEAGSFVRSNALVLGHYGVSSWDEIAAGAVFGPDANGLYSTIATGVSSFSPFGVGNVASFFACTTPPTPTITSGSPTTFCNGGSVTLSSSSATGNQWYLNGNPIALETNQTYVATASGNYTVIVTELGCSSAPSAATTVTVNPIPATPTITPGGPTTFCAGGSVTLSSSSATGNQWYLNGNPIGGETNQTYVANASGNYTVIVTALGCPSAPSVATTVTVNPTPATPTITAGGPTTFCTGGSVTLTSSSATGNQWYLNGNPIGGETNQTYNATASGNYTVVVTALGCPSAPSAATTVTVNPTPATPTITAGGPTTFCTGGSVTLTSSSATGNQWYLNGNPIGGETNQTYNATASGNYTVVVTALGCPSAPSAATTVTVNPTPPTPTITPGGPTTFALVVQ